jgi:hypothetical protein
MHNDQKQILDKLYINLLNTIEKDRKLKKKSAFLTLIDIKSNKRSEYLQNSGLPTYKILSDQIETMKSNSLIRETETVGCYVLTAFGLWKIENEKNIINEEKLIEYFDKKFFNPFKYAEQPLSDKYKIILLTLIAARSFSKESPINLHISDTKLDVIKETIDQTFDILTSMNVIQRLEKDKLYGKSGNEHPVSNLIRHSDKLPKQTKHIYQFLGDQKYYLQIFKNNIVSEANLIYLFKKIFENVEINIDNLESIQRFLENIAHSKSIYFYNDIKKHRFSTIEYDDIIKNALFNGCKINYSK